MRKITKLLTLALAALMIMSVMPVSAAFEDVSADDKALTEAVNLLTALKVVTGRDDKTFAPNDPVNRQEMATLVYRLMKAGRTSTGGANNTKFADLADPFYNNMISWAFTNGIINGTSETTFNPLGKITLQDAYTMVVRALGYETAEEKLIYPFGYTDKAEALGLDEDVPSTIDYTDFLTRGDVAIILANAFFADMNEKTVEYEWVTKTVETKVPVYDADGNPVLDEKDNQKYGIEYSEQSEYVAVETAHTIATKIFGVVEETFTVAATAHYAIDSAEPTYKEGEKDSVKNSAGVEKTMEELDLAGSSDDYFLAELTLYVKKATKTGEEDKIFATKSNLVKKTVTAADVVIDRSTKTDDKYYIGDKKNNEKVMTGLVTLGGIKAYIDDENASSAYKKENTEPVHFIALTTATYNEDDKVAAFKFTNNKEFKFDQSEGQTADNCFTLDFKALYNEMYSNGLYEADVYDIDGDGYANYIFYKPYKFFQIVDKKATSYNGVVSGKVNTKDAFVEGVKYESEDYVLGYVGNADEAYIKVVEVVKPMTATVVSKEEVTDKYSNVKLDNGTVLELYNATQKFDGAVTDAGLFAPTKDITVYAKDGIVLYIDGGIVGTDFDVNANYAMLINSTVEPFDTIVNGEKVTTYYATLLIDGAEKKVPLANTLYYYDGAATTYTNFKIKATTTAGDIKPILEDIAANDKFVTYTKNGDAYVLKEVKYAEWELATFADEENAKAAFGNYSDKEKFTTKFTHYTGSIYNFNDGKNDAKFKVNADSKIIIKSVETVNGVDEDTYTVYTAATLPKFDETLFVDVKVVLINNPKSDIEDLAIAYANIEKRDFGSKAAKDYKIVLGSTSTTTADETIVKHTLLNIKTGEKVEGVVVAGDSSAKIETGLYVELTAEGEIKTAITEHATSYTQNVLFTGALKGYDKLNKLIKIGDAGEFTLAADATILIYIDETKYLVADEDALILDVEELVYTQLQNTKNKNLDTALTIHAIGTDGKDDINVINTVVVTLDEANMRAE